MEYKYIRTESGEIKKVEKNNKLKIKHDNSAEEYSSLRTDLKQNLIEVNEGLNQLLSPIQKRVLKVSVENIAGTIKYYFSSQANRPNAYQDRLNTQSFTQIRELVRNMRNKTDEIVKRVKNQLKFIEDTIEEQRTYILGIEEQGSVLKRKNQNFENSF